MIRSHGHECHFVRGVIRGHSTVASNQSSPPGMQRAVGIKCTVPSFLPFPSITQSRNDVYLCMKLEERNENTSISSGVTDTNAISPRCNQGTFDGGATYRSRFVQSEQSSRHATTTATTTPTTTTTTTTITMHKCATCGRAFTRRFTLQRHASGCRPKPFTCDVCHSGFTRKWDLDQHKRTVQCGGPPQPGPAPKRRRIVASLNEDPVLAPPVEHAANDELSSAIRDAVRENWGSVRTHVVNGPVQTRYNHRLTSLDTRDLHDQLFLLFEEQTIAFKVNVSFGFILKQKATNRLRYYHSSNNCCGRYLEEPSLITNRDDFDRFLARIQESDILQWAVAQRPNSDWVCEHVTNATFFLNRIVDHPIGCVGINLPDYVKNNKAIFGLEKDCYRKTTYNDNLCLFRCLALHLGREAAALYAEYTDTPVRHFAGVTLDELDKVETTFKKMCSYISLSRSPMERRRLSLFAGRWVTTQKRCT